MSLNWTPIQWTWATGPDGQLIPMSGSTWNPILGCKEVSPGCANCYSARLIGVRFSRNPSLPMYHDIATTGVNGHPHFTGARRMMTSRLDEPLRARKGRKVFVNDMGDLFFEGHPFEDIARVFAVMALAQQHTFQVLTKRPERAAEFLREWAAGGRHVWTAAQGIKMPRGQDKPAPGWPLPNVWIGTSVEDQASADKRITHLLRVPAVVRFLSMEPLLGPVDLGKMLACKECLGEGECNYDLAGAWLDCRACGGRGTGIDWAIVGGESGPRARPFDLAWARSLRDQCRAAGTAFFFKQAGANPRESIYKDGAFRHTANVSLDDPHGGDMSEWPYDLRVREMPPAVPS